MDKPIRPIKSFVRRMGRKTHAQHEALAHLWPQFGVAPSELAAALNDWASGPLTVEIGFGDGECLTQLAARHPHRFYIGFEVHEPGVGHALLEIQRLELQNVRLIKEDAQAVLAEHWPAQSIDEVLIYFPDPWHKSRHHKRRLVQPAFLTHLSTLIKPQGLVRLATDWPDYAHAMVRAFDEVGVFSNLAQPGPFLPRPSERPQTKFERRGLRLGQPSWDLCYQRNADR
jgi:tRNA (guanine-N7-)-methyltransferase